MSKKKSKNMRSRDDSHLRKLVSETREWMRSQGIQEQALDWEAVAREEQALWWKERLRQALTDLAARSREFAKPIATWLRQLAQATESQAEAALEVTLDAAQRVGRVLFEPAQACVRPGANLQFSYAQPAMRSRLRLPAGLVDERNGVCLDLALFLCSAISGARVIADAAQGTVTVEFWEPLPSLLVVLVPEDPDLAPCVAEASKVNDTVRAVFDNLQAGRYLLSIYSLKEGDKA